MGYLALCACGAFVSTQTSLCSFSFTHSRTQTTLSRHRKSGDGFVAGPNPKFIIDDKNKMPIWAFDFCGGDEGIRTLDTLASIPHFQCGALDQLCDVS